MTKICSHCGSTDLKCLKTGIIVTFDGAYKAHADLFACCECGVMMLFGMGKMIPMHAGDQDCDAEPSVVHVNENMFEVLELNPKSHLEDFMHQWNPEWPV